MSELIFTCDKCPRTFKLQEFYDKHKMVHDLKKQHVCPVCGFVYGAAKGLEGHLKTHSEIKEEDGTGESVAVVKESAEPCNVTFLNPRGVLARAGGGTPDAFENKSEVELNGKVVGGTGSYDVFGTLITHIYI